jgi:hypothetical protein
MGSDLIKDPEELMGLGALKIIGCALECYAVR